MEFIAYLEKFDSNLWGYHFPVPPEVAAPFIDGNNRRVVARLNGVYEFQCALMPRGDGWFFININKKIRDQYKFQIGSEVHILLSPDNSQYGLPVPEELAELFQLDPDGSDLFHTLTPGKQRTLLYWIGQPKRTEGRIARALATIDHLRNFNGKLNYRTLYDSVKEYK